MDFSKIFIKDANPTKMGGQAVMEGIMMKGADRSAIAVRRADGSINIKEEPLPPKKDWMRWPVIRGVMAFVDSLVTGTRTLMYSAGVVEEDIEYDEEESEPGRLEQWIGDRFGEKGVFNFLLYSSVVIALVISVGVFVLLPTWVVGLCKAFTQNAIILNLIEGLLRIGMFIVYVALISRMQDIKRVFQYHGAEHQTIHCFENGLELTPENCAQFETLHPRCGTSFIMFVFIISLLLFSFLGWPNVVVRLLSRILLIPVVAGLSYELLRWAGRSDSMLVKVLSVPGLLMQKLTTRVPDESMLEVAIAAVNVCLSEEPPRERVFDVDGKGNVIDREVWKRAREIADGDISPEGRQAITDKTRRASENFDASADEMYGEESWESQRSPEAMQETIIFEELLKELERPDPVQKETVKSREEIDAINHVTRAAELFVEHLAKESDESAEYQEKAADAVSESAETVETEILPDVSEVSSEQKSDASAEELDVPADEESEDAKDVIESLAKKYAQEIAALSESPDEMIHSNHEEQEGGITLSADDADDSFVGMVGDDDEVGEKFEEEITESFEEMFRRETIELSSDQVDEMIRSMDKSTR